MWELDGEESWVPKNWCFWTVVLEKTFESPLDCKEIQPVHPKGNQSWVFIGRTDVEAEAPILWLPHVKSWLTWKDPDAGKDWRQEEKELYTVSKTRPGADCGSDHDLIIAKFRRKLKKVGKTTRPFRHTTTTTTIITSITTTKLLQSFLTLSNPRDSSPPASPVPGILQARTLEWVAISFYNAWK